MKKFVAMGLSVVLALSALTGCGSSANTSTESAEVSEEVSETVEEVAEATAEVGEAAEAATEVGETAEATTVSTIKDGVLMVGVEIGYPPMEYFDEDGSTPIGFDMEYAKALADTLGLELELVDTAWDGIFAGVDTDKYDVILSSVSYTEERDGNYCLSKPYVANAPVVVVPNDSDIADIADLSGKSVAVQMETTADYLVQEKIEEGLDTDLRQYEKVINAFDEIKAGRVDAVCTDAVVASFYLGDEASNYKTVWESPVKEPVVMCMKKGNDQLKATLEGALDELKANGKLAEIAVKYFGTDSIINVE